ncbi:MFS transporter [Aquicoccus sp. G2-2]|uniref:MFS transporter n=1 Tax=Aquicoccus sp. G2-2 TaxID=3092120 RepID=UPI002ADFD7A0|nr:MFS transporter [Aquicoccus sp. G2-2]MEA1114435.1 MFS transporter [Aquicoccus sp. G2-2]
MLFWHGVWFLYFQAKLSAADAVLLYAIYDMATTVLEVPSGYMSDRWGRKKTLVAAACAGLCGAVLLVTGGGFVAFALAQCALGAAAAFASGTDSALLYESLAATGREAEIERQELRAWRFGFVALALAAVSGGALALWAPVLPFVAGAVAFAALLAVALCFEEPPEQRADLPQGGELARLGRLGGAFRQPVLVWLFAFSLMSYVFGHVPYVFGQPFILQALEAQGWQAQAPLVSGVVSAIMMSVSLLASAIAMPLRRALGLGGIMLLALAMQVALVGVLALTQSVLAIGFLFLRMVPSAFSRPFMLARIQPLLSRESRATYLSLQSFGGRLVFTATLWLSALGASTRAEMAPGRSGWCWASICWPGWWRWQAWCWRHGGWRWNRGRCVRPPPIAPRVARPSGRWQGRR